MFLAHKGGGEVVVSSRLYGSVSCLKPPWDTYLLGGRLTVFGLVLLAQEEASDLHLGSNAMGDIAVTARFAGSGLNLGAGFAWGREREARLSQQAPMGAVVKAVLSPSLPARVPPHPTDREFGPGSCRRCGIGWLPA